MMDTRAELTELVVRSGMKVLEAMLEEDRTAICGPRYQHQAGREAGLLPMVLTGWLDRREREALAYLIEENCLLRRQLRAASG